MYFFLKYLGFEKLKILLKELQKVRIKPEL